jgi:hypothetical protein
VYNEDMSEPGRPNPPVATAAPAAVRMQILSTEHWSLLASRSMAWNESFTRAGMFLTTLSGAIVALALAAQANGFGREFAWFALAILPVVLFVGVVTFLRMGEANYHDALCVVGMNRIRHAYLEMAPDLAPYFVMSAHDDQAGLAATMAVSRHTRPLTRLLTSTPNVVSVLSSVVAATIGAMASYLLSAGQVGIALVAMAVFLASFLGNMLAARRKIARVRDDIVPLFPTPPATHPLAASTAAAVPPAAVPPVPPAR